MKFPFGENTTISRLRVPYSGDQLAARLHYARLFGGIDLHPASLPPQAIVCIRNLRDPSPRTLRLTRSGVSRSDAWRNSVTREIEKLYGRAFRPIRETVPAQAESVVFADNSELLACLASDWCEGLLAERWWWRSLFPNLGQAQTVARIWIESVEFVPPALQFLAKQGKAVKFVTKLQPDETNNLLRRIIRVFNLDKLRAALFEKFEEEKEFAVLRTEDFSGKQFSPPETYFSESFRPSAPWFQLVAETQHPALSFEQQCLLGIALTLARSPGIARTREFARQVKIFRSEFEINRTAAAQGKNKISERTQKPEAQPILPGAAVKSEKSSERKEKSSERKERSSERKEKSSERKEKSSERKEKSFELKEKSSKQKAVSIFEDLSGTEERSDEPSSSSSETESGRSSAVKKAQKKSEKIIFKDPSPERKPKRLKSESETKFYRAEKQVFSKIVSPEVAEETEIQFEFIVETRFGGVFYLLNLALYLNLYRDFTESQEAEIDLNIWDFVAFLGLEFLGSKIKGDPVWKLLERLAGRESEEELGREFAPADEWRVPREWLKTFQTDQKWLWIKTGKRLIVRHPAGFSVIDVPLHGAVSSRLESELEIYREEFSGLARSNLKDFRKYSSPSENWLKNLSEYVRARLFQALNVETQEQINAILFEKKAKITVTATHLDANLSLADLAFKVRLSGLDRNPSWIPAAGKFVNFHFN